MSNTLITWMKRNTMESFETDITFAIKYKDIFWVNGAKHCYVLNTVGGIISHKMSGEGHLGRKVAFILQNTSLQTVTLQQVLSI